MQNFIIMLSTPWLAARKIEFPITPTRPEQWTVSEQWRGRTVNVQRASRRRGHSSLQSSSQLVARAFVSKLFENGSFALFHAVIHTITYVVARQFSIMQCNLVSFTSWHHNESSRLIAQTVFSSSCPYSIAISIWGCRQSIAGITDISTCLNCCCLSLVKLNLKQYRCKLNGLVQVGHITENSEPAFPLTTQKT